MKTIDSIKEVNQLSENDFIGTFGNVFEKTESIALETFKLKPFKDFNDIISNMLNIYEKYEKDKIFEILNSHPELAVAKKLTSESKSEQASAKLNECSNEEYEEFRELNTKYREKFNFPFIIAVKGKDKNEILNNFRQRISNDIKEEFLEAKTQVKKIATFRLNEIMNNSYS